MAFTDERERDVFLTQALAILSGCLPGVKGCMQVTKFSECFSFAIAPAASGKGALKFAKMLADEYHSFVPKASREAESQYNQELSEHKQKSAASKKGDTSTEEQPTKPTFKSGVHSGKYKLCKKSFGTWSRTKAQVLFAKPKPTPWAMYLNKEWGSYSDMLRKSFHHERLSSSRKGNNEFTEVNEPSLSIALSGTPNQVTKT